MNDDILSFRKQLEKNKIHYNIKGVAYECQFIYVDTDISEEQNNIINDYIKKSEITIIRRFLISNNKSENQYIVFCLHELIIIIHQNQLHLLKKNFTDNTHLKIQFLDDTKEIFYQIFEKKFNEINIDFFDYIKALSNNIKFNGNFKSINKLLLLKITNYLSTLILYESYNQTFYNKLDNHQCPSIKEMQEDEYICLGHIGNGSSFFTFLIYHIREKKLFAMKKMKEFNDEHKNLMIREYNNYQKFNELDYPLIPKFIGKTVFGGTECNVIEYISGKTLDTIKQIDKIHKIYYIFQIMMNIEFFHLNGYVLRDLKTNNIIININNNAIFIDFDRVIYNGQTNHTKDLSSNYASPELNEDIAISYESDIWSLGKIIYFIVTGKIPKYDDDTINPKDFKGFDELRLIYNMCTRKEMKERPTISHIINLFCLRYFEFIEKFNIKKLFDDNEMMAKKSNIDDNEIMAKKSNIDDINALYMKNMLSSIKLRGSYNQINIIGMMDYYSNNSNDTNRDEKLLISLIFCGNKYIKEDLNKTMYYFSIAAEENNDPIAQMIMAQIFLDRNDIKQVIYYLSLAADKNNVPDAQLLLGEFFCRDDFSNPAFIDFENLSSILNCKNRNEFEIKYREFYKVVKNIPGNLTKGIEYLTKAANNNHPEALLRIGFFYLFHPHINRNINKGIKYLKKSSNQKNCIAQYILGLLYFDGTYVSQDKKKSIYYLSLAANQNHVGAQYQLATIYLLDEFYDFDKSISYFKLAADQNNANSQFFMGLYYCKILTDIKNLDILLKINSSTYNNLVINSMQNFYKKIYDPNKPFNFEKGIDYLTRSANQNNAYSQYFLGMIYITSPYIPLDINRGLYYLNKAAKQNIPDSFLFLGITYLCIIKNITKAKFFLTLAANHNIPFAYTFLGYIYYYVENNVELAVQYLYRGEPNEPKTDILLAKIFSNRNNKQYNIKRAINFYIMAANKNNAEAQFFLGIQNLKGQHVRKDINTGIDLISKSSENGFYDAHFIAGVIYHEGRYIKRDINKAIHFYIHGSNCDDQYSMNNLGIIYKTGFGVEKNIVRSFELFNKAYKTKKNRLSMYNIAKMKIYSEKNENDLIDSIELLIYASNKHLQIAHKLLCIALIKKYGNNIDNIKIQLRKNRYLKPNFDKLICNLIMKGKLNNPIFFKKEYEKCRNIEYVYNFDKKIVPLSELIKQKKDQTPNIKESKSLLNISQVFYEGFGLDI